MKGYEPRVQHRRLPVFPLFSFLFVGFCDMLIFFSFFFYVDFVPLELMVIATAKNWRKSQQQQPVGADMERCWQPQHKHRQLVAQWQAQG